MPYSFACPFCHAEWKLEELVKVAADVFSSFDGAGKCPQCKGTFTWVQPGTMDGQTKDGKKWWESAKRKQYKPHPCLWCGRTIEGPRRFCNTQCNKKWYYRKKHPAVKRKTPIISPPNRK
jgi:predicted nucleic acid-binding Zn ribbon protein